MPSPVVKREKAFLCTLGRRVGRIVRTATDRLAPRLPPCFLLRVTPSANRNSCRVAVGKPHPSLPQGEGAHHNLLKHSENELPPLGEGWGGASNQLFFYRQRRTFFTATGRFLNHAGCCRHARHGVGVGWRQHGGKLVFRLASPPSPKRRSRQQPPWLFVFISTPYKSSY